MTALQAHLTSEDHAGLPFHSGCPACRRERLSGRLPANVIVGSRARALLAAGILAGSAGVSTAGAVASTPEEAEVGGLLEELGNVPLTPEEQAEIDADAGAPDDEPEDAPDPAAAPPTTPPPVAQPVAPPPPLTSAPAEAPAAEKQPAPAPRRKSARAQPAPRPVAVPVPAPAPQPAPPVAHGPPPAAGGSHVVRAGESLWSIARDLLGPRAGNARMAIEVARMWELNAGAIGTGDPDLVMAGQRLRLPGHD